MHEDDNIDFSLGEIPADEEPREEVSPPQDEDGGRKEPPDPPAKFHTRPNRAAQPGFHTNMGGYGAGVSRGSAIHEEKRRREAEEKATGKDLLHLWIRSACIAAAFVAIAYALIVIALKAGENRGDLDVRKYADATAVTVDGEEMTFGDLAFYIMYEEMKVERQAEVYNPDNTRDYWNILMNGVYLSARVKDMVMGMAVHDRIFYNEAVRAGITLSTDEKAAMENRRTDFWEDLYPSQTGNLIASRDDINHVIYEIGLAEKYQQQLSIQNNVSYESYDWNGKLYEKLRDEEHTVKINDRIWHRFHMGNNTLYHGQANYIQDRDKQKKSKSQE